MTLKNLENNARNAKRANSFYDYVEGSATVEYNRYCETAEEVAERAIKKIQDAGAPQDSIDRVKSLLEKYKVKKLEWLNSIYINRASVPSVMISGAGNFPIARKERQNNREKALFENNPEYIIDKIKSIGNDADTIRSDDPNAVQRIKDKIKRLEESTGNSAEIRRLKERLLVLAPEEFKEEQQNITVNGVKTYEEIVKLWESGRVYKSEYNPSSNRYYYDLYLEFYNGKRHYKEFINLEVDETGLNRIKYDLEKNANVTQPLTDEVKYFIIIGRISGSGNKAIMYKHLKSLAPSQIAKQAEATAKAESGEAETVKVGGEEAEIIRNKELMRLQLKFEGKPSEQTRSLLKGNGFRWAPSQSAWQRQLTSNAEYALKRITDQ